MDVPLKLIVKDVYVKLRMKIFESFLSSMGNLSNSERRKSNQPYLRKFRKYG